jgi:ankyrin repeat protein
MTPLSQAARDGDASTVRQLLDIDPPPARKDLWDALIFAVGKGKMEVVDVLLGAGVEVDWHPEGHMNALHVAIEQQQIPMILRLLAAGADLNSAYAEGFTPLHHAVDLEGDSYHQTGEEEYLAGEMTALLLARGADVWAKDSSGQTPLDLARRYQHQVAVRLIQERMSGESPVAL